MDWYDDLGVLLVINAAGRYTHLGGSVMPAEVITAMADAARCHVDMHDLQRKVGRRLAELTHNEAAYVTCGAAAGIALAVLACRTGADEAAIRRVAEGRGPASEVVVQRAHRVPYIPAITLAGATVVECGTLMGTDRTDLEAAITERTSAIVFVAGEHLRRGSLELASVVDVARDRDLPVIVDAAAQLPPAENLWRFTRDLGAAAAVFSGGKDLCGPQPSGLIVGRADLIEAIRLHGSPYQRIARAMKVGKEEVVGLLAAVQLYLRIDDAARREWWESVLTYWTAQLSGLPGVHVERDPRNEAGQPIPRLLVSWPPGPMAPTTESLAAHLLEAEPAVAVAAVGERTVGLTPEIVTESEVEIVGKVVREALLDVSRHSKEQGET